MNEPEIKKYKFVSVFSDVYFILAVIGIVLFEILAVYAMSVGLGHAGPEGAWGGLAMLGILTNFIGLGVAVSVEGHAASLTFFWLVVGVTQTLVDLALLFFIRANQLLKRERESRLKIN